MKGAQTYPDFYALCPFNTVSVKRTNVFDRKSIQSTSYHLQKGKKTDIIQL